MSKELVIIYDAPSTSYLNIISIHNLGYYLRFFDRIRVLYWAEKEIPEIFERENGKFTFYPYCKPYNSGYFTGIKFMFWIGRNLWHICKKVPDETKLILMPVIPIWAGLPTLIVGKIKRKKVVLRLEAEKIKYISIEESLEGRLRILTVIKLLFLKLIYRLTLPLYDFVIAISGGVLKEAADYKAKNITKIPIPININPFLGILRENSCADKKLAILFVGQIKKIKGIDNLVKVLDFLYKEKKLHPKLLITGKVTNPKDENFFEEIKKLSQGLDVEFLGEVPHWEIEKIYEKADIFILPSYSEALGMTIMEAMASGLPVVSSDVSGPRDLVEDGRTGFLVEPGNLKMLSERLIFLLSDSELRKKMGQAGRQRIKEIMARIDADNQKLWQEIIL